MEDVWRVVGGPFEYYDAATPEAIAVGWSWDLTRHGECRVIRIEIDKSANAKRRFRDAEQALLDVLHEDDPPGRLLLTWSGVVRPTDQSSDVRRSA